jgi:hypothetical protein
VTHGEKAPATARGKFPRVLLFAVFLALVVAAPVVRVFLEGRGEDRASEAALFAGDVAGATVHARRAATAYVPYASHVRRSYDRLKTIAEDAELRGNADAALFAWRAIRSASIGSSFIAPVARGDRRTADVAIARLSAMTRAASVPGQRALAPDMARHHLAELEADAVPSRARVAVLLGGLSALVGGAIWLVKRALSADGSVDLARAKGAAALVLFGGVGWVVGLLIV